MRKLLIVDDDEIVTNSIARFFETMGYNARCAYDSDEAMKLIKEDKPDCVLLDIQLPGTRNGVDVLEEAKNINKNIKVIIITAFVDREIEEQCNKLNTDGYIIKPLDFQKLLDMVKKITET